jgi:hypothetical protein
MKESKIDTSLSLYANMNFLVYLSNELYINKYYFINNISIQSVFNCSNQIIFKLLFLSNLYSIDILWRRKLFHMF